MIDSKYQQVRKHIHTPAYGLCLSSCTCSKVVKCVTDGHLLSSGQEGLVSETLGHRLHSICNNLGSWLKSLLTELLCCRVSTACCSSCWLQDLMSQVTCHWLSILLNSLQGSREWLNHNCQPRSWQCLFDLGLAIGCCPSSQSGVNTDVHVSKLTPETWTLPNWVTAV